jgi:uncharacterized protein (DUF2132 family)
MRRRSCARTSCFSEEPAISSAIAFCMRASVARNQLLATSAASDWRAYSASSAAEVY